MSSAMNKDDRRKSDGKGIDSELIGIVYQVAFDPIFWSELLEGISNLFKDRRYKNLASEPIPDDDFEKIQFFSNKRCHGIRPWHHTNEPGAGRVTMQIRWWTPLPL